VPNRNTLKLTPFFRAEIRSVRFAGLSSDHAEQDEASSITYNVRLGITALPERDERCGFD
jgi:hypothetical protein